MHGKIFKVQVKLMDFNITQFRELIDIITDFIVQLTFENYHLSNTGEVAKNIRKYFLKNC